MTLGETGRQAIHIAAGLLFIALALQYGREFLIELTFALLIFGSILIHMRLTGSKFFIIEWIERTFERKESRFPGWGPAWYLVGVLMLAVFLGDATKIAAGIYILAVGDGISTLAGIRGKHRLPLNSKKSIEGTIAFFVACLPLYAIFSYKAIPLALVAAAVEAYSINIEDNLSIPLACVIMLSLL
jgi:dolichol kinase